MQTITVNNEAYGDATEATVFGPFFVQDAPRVELGGDIAADAAARPAGSRAPSPTPAAHRCRGTHRGVGGG